MTKPKTTPPETPSKAHHVFPAPEWTSVSASLAASLAHEIRNPLLSIKGAAQLLEGMVSEEDKSLAALIITEATRIEKLIATMDPLTPNPSPLCAPVLPPCWCSRFAAHHSNTSPAASASASVGAAASFSASSGLVPPSASRGQAIASCGSLQRIERSQALLQ